MSRHNYAMSWCIEVIKNWDTCLILMHLGLFILSQKENGS